MVYLFYNHNYGSEYRQRSFCDLFDYISKCKCVFHQFLISFIMGNCESINENQIQAPRQGPVSSINIHNFVWSRKYLGLYDYEAHQVEKRKYKAQGNCVVLKDNEKLILIDERMDKIAKAIPEVPQLLQKHYKNAVFRLVRNDNFYQLIPLSYEEKGELVQKPVWLIVRSLPKKVFDLTTQEYSIKERDILKLGKQKMRVREVVPQDCNPSVIMANSNIQLSKAIYEELHYQQKLKLPISKDLKQQTKQQKDLIIQSTKTICIQSDHENQVVCRICLQPGLTSNPLITPCLCTGTVKHIHLLCLKTWLSKQIKAVINDFSVTINWKPLSCEMCKSHYKYRIYLDNQKFYTVDIPKPQKPYIVLEIMKKKHKDDVKIFKFITFKQKNKINVGRKKDVDVRISDDISVSRIHATLKYRPDTRQFILEDNKSKFGTLVLAKNGINLRPHHMGISVQVGAEMYQFQPIREAALVRSPNYEMGDSYMREEISQMSDEEQDENGSEEDDYVPELPLDDNDRESSPLRSPTKPIRRSQSLQPDHGFR